MIVTRDLLVTLGAPKEILDWLDAAAIYGIEAIPFATALISARKPEWVAWARDVVQGPNGIKAGVFEYFGPVRAVSPYGVDQLADVAAAQALLQQRKTAFAASVDYAFSVNAAQVSANGNKTLTPCDINAAAPHADFFEAFDYQTGTYTQFPDFDAAKAYVQARQAGYLSAAARYFTLQQKVRRVGDTLSAWDEL